MVSRHHWRRRRHSSHCLCPRTHRRTGRLRRCQRDKSRRRPRACNGCRSRRPRARLSVPRRSLPLVTDTRRGRRCSLVRPDSPTMLCSARLPKKELSDRQCRQRAEWPRSSRQRPSATVSQLLVSQPGLPCSTPPQESLPHPSTLRGKTDEAKAAEKTLFEPTGSARKSEPQNSYV